MPIGVYRCVLCAAVNGQIQNTCVCMVYVLNTYTQYTCVQVREIREVIKSTKQQLEEIQSQFSPINRPSLVVEVQYI